MRRHKTKNYIKIGMSDRNSAKSGIRKKRYPKLTRKETKKNPK